MKEQAMKQRHAGVGAFLLLMALDASMSAAYAGTSETPPLEVRLESPKAAYAFGEEVEIFVIVTNRSEQRQMIRPSDSVASSRMDSLSLTVDDGRPIPMVGNLFLSMDAIVLEPKQAVRFRYGGWWLTPGRHQVRVRYAYKPECEAKMDLDGVWCGSVDSSPITILVGQYRDLSEDDRTSFDARQERLIARLPALDPKMKSQLQAVMVSYMPLTRKLMGALLVDECPRIRGSVISSLGFLADRGYAERASMIHDVSLIPQVIALGSKERDPYAKGYIAVALRMASGSLSGQTKEDAFELLEKYLYDPNGHIAGHAAFGLIAIDRQRGARALRKRVSGKRKLNPHFRNILIQALVKTTGKSDIREALTELEMNREP